MVDFCESYSPFHVSLTIHPSAHLVYATSHLSIVTFFSFHYPITTKLIYLIFGLIFMIYYWY